MFVYRRMKKRVLTIGRNETLLEAKLKMKRHKINQLPVTEGKKLVGIISKRDIQAATMPILLLDEKEEVKIRTLLAKTKVEKLMTKSPVVATVSDTLEDAVIMLHDYRVNSLPVLDEEGNLVGIITKTDILEAFMEALGVQEISHRLEVVVDDKPGALADVVNTIKEFKTNLISIMTTPYSEKGKRIVYIRIATLNVVPIKEALRARGITILESWKIL